MPNEELLRHLVQQILQGMADRIRECDQGLIAGGRLALHYYVAAFGTLASCVGAMGEKEAADLLRQGDGDTSSPSCWLTSYACTCCSARMLSDVDAPSPTRPPRRLLARRI